MRCDAIYRGETRSLDEEARRLAGGAFIQLSQGWTHYEWAEAASGPTVVLIHGFSVPYFIWDPTFDALAGARFRPLRYDLYGRGFSDRPRIQYDLDTFVQQLDDLLEALSIEPAAVIGLSMGGPIAAAYASKFAARVLKVVLVDPVGTRPIPTSALFRLAALPAVGEMLFGLLATEPLVRAVASDFFDRRYVQQFQARYRVQMQFRGFRSSLLSSIRSGMLAGFPEVYATLGRTKLPVLLFWGENDRTVPFAHSRDIVEAVPRAQLVAVAGCSHLPHYEKPGQFNARLLQFLADA
jgi:pimeloyl-ACP methyl ester carboxylesterase